LASSKFTFETDGDELCVLDQKSGLWFYGPETSNAQKNWYKAYSLMNTSKIPFSHFQICQDIIIRYYLGGLKLGGPHKQQEYQVKSGDVVSEMGSYMGYYAMRLAMQVGNTGKVVAIEPIDENVAYMRKNISRNKLEQITVIQSGVWDSEQKIEIKRDADQKHSTSIDMDYENAERIMINVNSLDNLFKGVGLNTLDYCIIQLNGAELKAVKGLEKVEVQNLSIAARYGGVKKIEALLQTRNYSTVLSEQHFLFAHKQS